MKPHLKKLKNQVVVITGASSGIGLTTGEMAAERGARVVMAARSERELTDAVARINAKGGRATAVVADVSDEAQVEGIARHATREFGGFDTWVNNAGIGMYGRLVDQAIADKRRLFDTDFWSVVYGCQAALPLLRDGAGAERAVTAVPARGGRQRDPPLRREAGARRRCRRRPAAAGAARDDGAAVD